MKPFFSIVMPTYGVENYIKRAIDSVRAQTFTDWELLVIDDATPDQSAKIAADYANTDPRIRVIYHDVNKGLSAARNSGIEAAYGAYIWFMDPDDYVEPDVLIQAYASIEKNPAEVVLFGHVEEYFDKNGKLQYIHKIIPEEHLFTDQTRLRKNIIHLEQQTLYGYAWNKIYQLEYLTQLKLYYEDVQLIEDILFNVKFCMDIQRMNVLSITPYHYAKRLGANLTNKFVPEYFELHQQRIEIIYEQYNYWGLCTNQVRGILGGLYGRYILSALQRNCDKQAGMNHAERYRWCLSLFNEGLFNDLIPCARAQNSKNLKMSLRILRRKRAMLCLFIGRIIYIAREKLPMLHSRIKSER